MNAIIYADVKKKHFTKMKHIFMSVVINYQFSVKTKQLSIVDNEANDFICL